VQYDFGSSAKLDLQEASRQFDSITNFQSHEEIGRRPVRRPGHVFRRGENAGDEAGRIFRPRRIHLIREVAALIA
jgi:hypothetical protein